MPVFVNAAQKKRSRWAAAGHPSEYALFFSRAYLHVLRSVDGEADARAGQTQTQLQSQSAALFFSQAIYFERMPVFIYAAQQIFLANTISAYTY